LLKYYCFEVNDGELETFYMKTKCLLLLGSLLLPVSFALAADTGITAKAATASPEAGFSGKVVETMNTAGYTYVQVDTGSQKLWAATTQFAVKVGDTVSIGAGAPMNHFHSQSLNRDFDVVYFVGKATVTSGASATHLDAGFTGKVQEVLNTSGYTYVRVDNGTKSMWAATTEFPVKVGDNVTVAPGAPMSHYQSPTLKREFDLVFFTGRITVNDGSNAAGAATLPPGHPALTATATAANMDLKGIKRADGGKTVQEIFAGKTKLAGTAVSVRGKVVKYNAMIMGKNWLHIQDGSGTVTNKDNDLTITTSTAAKVGDTVLVTGSVSLDRDYGAGYKYNVILDDAKVTVE